MNRRTFITRLGSGLAGSATLAGTPRGLCNPAALSAAPVETPAWRLGYRSITEQEYQAEVPWVGEVPKVLRGAFYRNGPAQHDIGSFRYSHWFDGDGLVQRFGITGNGKLSHLARPVATAKRTTEQALGRAALPAFGTLPPQSNGVASADDLNPANISILPHHGSIYALWEAGSAHEIDAASLATVGPKQFSADTAGLPFSAHPRVEADGTLWNFGYASAAGIIVLWHIDAAGVLKRCVPLKVGATGMPHDFIVTERHIVLLLAPLHQQEADGVENNFLDQHHWDPAAPTKVLVVSKETLTITGSFDLPAQWVFHFGNGYEDRSGNLVFDAARSASPDILTKSFRAVMTDRWVEPPPSLWTTYTIDLKRQRIREETTLGDRLTVEFPRVDPRRSCRQHNSVWMLSGTDRSQAPGALNTLTRYDRFKDRVDSFTYPTGTLVEEHTFIPKTGAATDGWLLGTSLDLATEQTVLSLFDAFALSRGPLAQARLPYAMPLGFHGAWAQQG